MRKSILLFVLTCFIFQNIYAQNFTVSGKMTDENTGESLIGATVMAGEKGTITDLDGSYELELPAGKHALVYSYVGFEQREREINLSGNVTIDISLGLTVLSEVVVTADIAIERRTPIAFSNIPTLKLQEELASQDIPMILNSTPGTYATQSGGGDGDARITIRGFNQRNVAVMLDGVPVNDMENGWVYWSNWFGLDVVTQTIQVQRGLGASKLSIPSVGGTINILTKGIDAKKSIRLQQEFGTGNFLRTTLGLTTGRMKNGWGISAAGSYKRGNGWVDGTFTEGAFYYLRVDKQFGNHLIGFQGFGAPQEHGQRPFTAEIAQVDADKARSLGVPEENILSLNPLDKGRRFNEHWGWRYTYDEAGNPTDSTLLNTRKNYYHKPQLSLRHSWQASNRMYWSNVAYLSIGNGGGTAPEGNFIRNNATGQFDIAKTMATNEPTFFNPDGLSNAFLRGSINNHFWYGLLSTLKYDLAENLTISGGIDGRYYKGDHRREVYDLLGGTGINWGNEVIGEGGVFDYDYTGFVRWAGAFGLLEYSNDRYSAFVNLSGANTGYRAEDAMRNQELDWVNLGTVTAKAGAGYNINEKQNVFLNVGYLNKAQRFTNVININAFGDSMSVFQNFENEEIQAIELGYGLKSRIFSANLNAYYTNWLNKPLDSPPTVARDPSDPESERVRVNIPGIDAIHMGVELEFSIEPVDKLAFEGVVSVGDWRWNSSSSGLVDLGGGIVTEFEFDATGVHVGDAAQTQIGAMIRYEPIKRGYIKLRGTHFARNWADFQPESLKPNTPTAGRESWQLPNYTLFDLHLGYGTYIRKRRTGFRMSVLNLFDTVYLSDGRNNDQFNQEQFSDFDAKSASVHFGQGIRWNASVQVEF